MSGPAWTLSNSRQSSTVLAIGPSTLRRLCQPIVLGTMGMRPIDGRKPMTLQKAAGFLSDPPRSLPSAIGNIRQASAAAAPPLLPPATLVRSYGFRVAPNKGLNVFEPAPNSGVLVLPMIMAPAFRMRSTINASDFGTRSRKMGEPMVVRIPRVWTRSLIAMGSPASGPVFSPWLIARSITSACARASSVGTSVQMALICPFNCSM